MEEEIKIDWKVIDDEDYYLSLNKYQKQNQNKRYYQKHHLQIRKKYRCNRSERLKKQKKYDNAHKAQKHEYYLKKKTEIQKRNNNYRKEHLEQYKKYTQLQYMKNKMKRIVAHDSKSIKPKVMCIIGGSGTGKTEASLYLKRHHKTCNLICSYTTRPKREGEINGREHWFVQEEKIPKTEDMLAYTEFGNYKYWALKGDIQPTGVNVYVIDEDGYRWFKEKYRNDYRLYPVHILRNMKNTKIDAVRLARDINRIPLNCRYFKTINNNNTLENFFNKINNTYKTIEEI